MCTDAHSHSHSLWDWRLLCQFVFSYMELFSENMSLLSKSPTKAIWKSTCARTTTTSGIFYIKFNLVCHVIFSSTLLWKLFSCSYWLRYPFGWSTRALQDGLWSQWNWCTNWHTFCHVAPRCGSNLWEFYQEQFDW